MFAESLLIMLDSVVQDVVEKLLLALDVTMCLGISLTLQLLPTKTHGKGGGQKGSSKGVELRGAACEIVEGEEEPLLSVIACLSMFIY